MQFIVTPRAFESVYCTTACPCCVAPYGAEAIDAAAARNGIHIAEAKAAETMSALFVFAIRDFKSYPSQHR
ncbi:hypothetical protein BSFA1_69900 (plasmid) [Burkholderia sp. SFA1]|nr:hypothetical protein BSFA1_69900 [Burkholderia sp. SFA1]